MAIILVFVASCDVAGNANVFTPAYSASGSASNSSPTLATSTTAGFGTDSQTTGPSTEVISSTEPPNTEAQTTAQFADTHDVTTQAPPNTTPPTAPPTSQGATKTVQPTSKAAATPKPATPKPTVTAKPNAKTSYSEGNYTGPILVNGNKTSSLTVEKDGVVIDYGNAENGYIMVKTSSKIKTKVRVVGPTGVEYTRYTIMEANVFYSIPLQMGNGNYEVSVLENVSGNSYIIIAKINFNVTFKTEYTLMPNIFSNYDADSTAVKKGYDLCMSAASDLEKVRSVYNYLISNIKYDYELAATVTASYVPDPDRTLKNKKGICFDYAALMAAMLRPQNVPTRIIIGYIDNNASKSHAWNEVYIKGIGWIAVGIESKGGWKRLDSTFGVGSNSAYLENDKNYTTLQYY